MTENGLTPKPHLINSRLFETEEASLVTESPFKSFFCFFNKKVYV
jgi:hypothetical protein